MNRFDYLPPDYLSEIERQKKARFAQVDNNTYSKNSSVSNMRVSDKVSGKAVPICAVIGAIVGLFSFCAACSRCNGVMVNNTTGTDSLTASSCELLGGVGTFFLSIIIGLAVGGIIELIIAISRKAVDSGVSNSINKNYDKAANTKQEITNEYNKKYNDYVVAFEQEAMRQSVNYVESKTAKEVIEWITNGFAQTINSADRRPHIQQIDIPFIIKVYQDEITTNIGTYNFEIHRCARLSTPIMQAALTKALANSIRLNIAMQFPKDLSGSIPKIDINYDYSPSCAIATIRYLATNAKYIKESSWNLK